MTSPNWVTIQSENPSLTINNPEEIGEGWGAWAYRVNADTVFKIPKREGAWDENAKEIAVLTFLESRLPLLVPKPLFHRQYSAGWPYGYAAYSLVPGDPIDPAILSDGQKSAAARTIANFLHTLHNLTPTEGLLAHLDQPDFAEEYRQICEKAEEIVLPQLSHDDAERVRTHVKSHLGNPANFAFRPTLIHSDLHNEHLLVQEGVVTGVLDFGDAILGDPDDDFSDFYEDLGPEFLLECAEHYGHPNPSALINKIRERSVFGYLHDIIHGPEYGLPGDVEWAWAALKEWLLTQTSL